MFVEKLIKDFNPLAENIRRLHHGYVSDTYVFNIDQEQFVFKQICIKPLSNITVGLDEQTIFSREVESLRRLGSITQEQVVVPSLLKVFPEKCAYIIPYYEYTEFNTVLLLEEQAAMECIEKCAQFLANFHNNHKLTSTSHEYYLHGDLNNKNIGLLTDTKVLLLDPSYREGEYKGSLYVDVSRMLLNFFPYNPLIYFKLSPKRKIAWAKHFLDVYHENTQQDFSPREAIRLAQLILHRKNIQRPTKRKMLKHKIMTAMESIINQQLVSLYKEIK